MGADTDSITPIWGTLVTVKSLTVLAMFLFSTLVYAVLEGLTLVDAAYCATGVITTVGQVIVPVTILGRLFTAILNVVSLGVGVLYILEISDLRRDAVRRALALQQPKGKGGSAGLSGASSGARTMRSEVAVLLLSVLPPVFIGAAVLQYCEGWESYGEAVYFCIITASGESTSVHYHGIRLL